MKLFKLLLLLSCFSIITWSCKKTTTNQSPAIVQVKVKNYNALDSIVIYDKENSWNIKSSLQFDSAGEAMDTLTISEQKLYPMYSFSKGNQKELGTLLLSATSSTKILIDEQLPYESIQFSGDFEVPNNFFAFAKNQEHTLSEIAKKGIEATALETQIEEKQKEIQKKGNSLPLADSLFTYVKDNFTDFSAILRKKNEKYRYKASLTGKIGNEFSFKNANGETIKLSDFKGKYIYIDVWATWCKPCKAEQVFLEKLEEKFTAKDPLVFMAISIDSNVKNWKKYISEKEMQGIQLHAEANSSFVKFYDIGALPRFIFLDKEGKIISPDEIRPSNSLLLEKLNTTIQ